MTIHSSYQQILNEGCLLKIKLHPIKILLSILVGFSLQPCQASTAVPEVIQEKIVSANLPADSVSIVVQPLETMATNKAVTTNSISLPTNVTPLIDYNANIPRTPASTQKLIPTYIALDSLGKDFTWQTKLYQHGIVWRGTLYGDIIVQGSGDPKLESERLYQLLNMIKSQGIERVEGDLIIDNHQFQQVNFDVNAFDGKGSRPYNAQPNALLTDFGTIKVDLTPISKPTAKASIPVETTSNQNDGSSPAVDENSDAPHPELGSEVQSPTIKPSDIQGFQVAVTPNLDGFRYPTQLAASQTACNTSRDDWIASVSTTSLNFNQIPSAQCGKQQRWLTFPDGNVLLKQQIIADWKKILPNFTGKIRMAESNSNLLAQIKPIPSTLPWYIRWYLKLVSKPITPKLIAYVNSNPLSQQIKDINQHSNNVMTEQIALSLPLYMDKQPTSDYPKTFDYIHRWWLQHLPQAKPPTMTRASGLCRECQVMPSSMMALLTYAYRSPNFLIFRDSLGIAGESGTIKALKWRQPNNPAIGRGWIKTGTLDNVTSMAGYIQGQSGKWYAVVGMINAPNVKNNDKAKAVLDEMLAWTALQ